jgi:hypothetical protein
MTPSPADEITPMPPSLATAEASPARDMPTPIPPCTMGTEAHKFPIFSVFIYSFLNKFRAKDRYFRPKNSALKNNFTKT